MNFARRRPRVNNVFLESEFALKRKLIRFLIIIGLPVFAYFSLENIFAGKTIIGSALILLAVLLAVFVVLELRTNREETKKKIVDAGLLVFVVFLGLILLYVVAIEHKPSRLQWVYLITILVFYAYGPKAGITWVGLFSLALLAIILTDKSLLTANAGSILERFFISHLTLGVVTAFLEFSRRRAMISVSEKHDDLVSSREELRQANESLKLEIEEREKAQRSLQISQARFQALFESAPIPAYAWSWADDDLVLTGYNRAALEFTSHRAPEFVGVKAADAYADRPDMLAALKTCYDTGEPFREEMDYAGGSAEEGATLMVSCTRIEPDQVLVYAEDITERKRAEQARKAQVKLEGVMEMAGAACHELAQPFQMINTYVEMLADNLAEESELKGDCRLIMGQMDRIRGIIRKIQNITQYAARDYGGVTQIIDIDRASEKH